MIVAMSEQASLSVLEEAIAAARAEAGSLLACFRHAAGLSQVQLAGLMGYSATAVAHAERAWRPVSAEFWELADEALAAHGRLTAEGTRISALTRTRREEQRRLDNATHAGILSQLLLQPDAAAPAVLRPAITVTASAVGRCPHCHQPLTLVTQIAAPPDRAPGQDRQIAGS
jgi:Helix-turn-helix domain